MSTRPDRKRKVRKEQRQFALFVPVRRFAGEGATEVVGWEVDPGRAAVVIREDGKDFLCNPAELDLALPRAALEKPGPSE
jgi:hypothetical protein